ncbi:M20/M25/M40 family metallo-hydrolase [Promicromonospora citrea]|nr:M20/M25/M40 family metallo-hydrolase [Promicromonospora citrea]NNH54197.1 M20/M25/M40 family metallo-hydrolase [Promicromonospora citrea]
MSADTDPTEAIPQVTAEMIAKAAARPAPQPAQAPAESAPAQPPAPPEPPAGDAPAHGPVPDQPAAPDAVLPGGASFASSEQYGDGHLAAGHIAAAHLSSLVQIPTVSAWDPDDLDHESFARHRAALAAFYPRVHALQSEPVGEHGLLFRWPGRGREDVLHPFPVVLVAHQDVAPVLETDWAGDPFSGEIRDGVVHGRGAVDGKGVLVAVLDAVETLLGDGFVPERDVWLFFGADQETTGQSAERAVRRLYELGVRPWLVLDQGAGVVTDAVPGVEKQVALVGVAEKGRIGVDLYTTDAGGHAATPGRRTATGRLGRAVARVSGHAFPARVSPPTAALLERVAPGASGARGALLRLATRLSSGPLRGVAAWLVGRGGPEAWASVRTTAAVTELEGSVGATVAASSARAHVDVRVALGDTVERTVARLRRVIGDKGVELEVLGSGEPSEVSPYDGQQFTLLGEAVGSVYPDAVVAPHVQLAASDARAFTPISDHVYRLSPFVLTAEQRRAVHGAGERLSVESLARGVHFYREVLRKIPG